MKTPLEVINKLEQLKLYIAPHVWYSTHDRSYTMEFWKGEKKVTIILSEEPSENTVLKIWGASIDTEMEEHELNEMTLQESFRWIRNES